MRARKTEERVYQYLKEQIETGVFGPNQKIIENDVALTLAVSRSPVRGAIQLLAAEKYLVLEPNKGAVVRERQMTQGQYLEKLEVIELLLINYLFQLEAKKVGLPVTELTKQGKALAALVVKEQAGAIFQQSVVVFSLILQGQSNVFYKELVVTTLSQLFASEYARAGDKERVTAQLLQTHLTQLLKELLAGKYAHCRREIRILLNNLTLEVIDNQELGKFNKYQN